MKKAKILLRFDDICPTMNWELWSKAKSLLDSVGATALLGIIPDCKDSDLQIDEARDDFWEYIKELQDKGYSIAMHGYQHTFDIRAKGIVTRKKHSEFAGHSYETQYEKIKKGKEILQSHGIETDIFFAPAHSYDDNTLKALAALGFKFISDGKSSKPYIRNGIKCIPARSAGIPTIRRKGNYTVVLHAHEWAWKDKKYNWGKLVTICQEHKNELTAFDDFANQDCGYSIVQRLTEWIYLKLEYFVFPTVIRVLSFIKVKK